MATRSMSPRGKRRFEPSWRGNEPFLLHRVHCCSSVAGGKRVDESGTVTVVTSTNQPESRYHHAALWNDSGMLLWGGMHAINQPPDYFEVTPAAIRFAIGYRRQHSLC